MMGSSYRFASPLGTRICYLNYPNYGSEDYLAATTEAWHVRQLRIFLYEDCDIAQTRCRRTANEQRPRPHCLPILPCFPRGI